MKLTSVSQKQFYETLGALPLLLRIMHEDGGIASFSLGNLEIFVDPTLSDHYLNGEVISAFCSMAADEFKRLRSQKYWYKR